MKSPPPSIPFQRDALGEITNVLCGNMLPLLSNTKAEFHLQTPTIISDDKIAQVSRGATVSVQVGLDDYGRADVFLRMN
ncbi:MAG: chemotaxis protein CheX [Gemmatimonadota bacterium]|nr:chemotaxis protein CheX [Gemmatimonadota bacterium]